MAFKKRKQMPVASTPTAPILPSSMSKDYLAAPEYGAAPIAPIIPIDSSIDVPAFKAPKLTESSEILQLLKSIDSSLKQMIPTKSMKDYEQEMSREILKAEPVAPPAPPTI